ncbi:MAG: glycosyltransferase [Alistipes sp.]|jgi:glycosyltransferase involved in cell wall biosynthesis|nr:glycosyltransferase [Alistipes sp.]
MYNYSIIIPHKNIPELLERCLASIPVRDDVQIIIVDDSSEERLVDFARFPGKDRPHTEIIFHKSSLGIAGGAGHARNVGLEVARGRWLIFADADDFFHPAIGPAMDRHANSDADMIFFRHDSAESSTLEPVAINTRRNRILDELDRTGDDTKARFLISVPWGRFIRRELVRAHDIRFDEVRFSAGTLFSLRAGYFAEKIVSDPEVVYCNVRREGSLIREGRRDWEAMSQRFDVDYRASLFACSVGRGELLETQVAERWKELSLLHRRGARRLLPRLRDVCSGGVVRRVRFEEAVRRALSVFIPRKRKRNILRHL